MNVTRHKSQHTCSWLHQADVLRPQHVVAVVLLHLLLLMMMLMLMLLLLLLLILLLLMVIPLSGWLGVRGE